MRRSGRRVSAPFRLVPAVLLAAALAAPIPATSANAAVVPTASCVDGNYFDGLDTRYAATYCKSALSDAGYNAERFTNTDATPVLNRQPTDGVFYHAGHAILYCESATNCTAISSAFAGATPNSTFYTGLLGDALAANWQGPGTVCDGDGSCRTATFLNYPYTSEMQKVNLAVFQSCKSARDGAGGYLSPTTVAYETGLVGTAIGFKSNVAWIRNRPGINLAGDAFARRFWSDLKAGHTYSYALVDAVNAAGGSTYGYSAYVYRHDSTAPSRLRPAQYFVPGTASSGAGPMSPSTGSNDLRVRSVARALDMPEKSVKISDWRTIKTAGGREFEATVAGVGGVILDGETLQLRQVIYERALAGSGKPQIAEEQALKTAERFARRYAPASGKRTLRAVDLLDHDSFAEYRIEWQDRDGKVWTPSRIAVGVNAATGEVAYYWEGGDSTSRQPRPEEPTVTASQATARALRAAGLGSQALAHPPHLEVEETEERALVWSVRVEAKPAPGLHMVRERIVHVDATDGTARVWATT